MECGRLQRLSLGVINSTVESECWKVTERGPFPSENQSKPVCYRPPRVETRRDPEAGGLLPLLSGCFFFLNTISAVKELCFCVFSW